MFSQVLTIRSNDVPSTSSGPSPFYNENGEVEKRAVEVCGPPPAPYFDPIEKQRHFGLLRSMVDNRFRKMMFFGLISVLIMTTVLILILLTLLKSGKLPAVYYATTDLPVTKSTTSQPPTTQYRTTTAMVPDSCTPQTPTTFLFAYSNDFDSQIVDYVLNTFKHYWDLISPHFISFATIRFDLQREDDFGFYNTWDNIDSFVKNHLPDPSLGFRSAETGSDVLRMIKRFLNNTQVPVCGSQMFILVKRYPNETDISRIVSKLRQHHSVLKIAVSRAQSGGHHPETLYSMASRTNGLCVFSEDFGMEAVVDHMQAIFYPYLIYVADPDVSGTGTIQLTSMNAQQAGIYNFYMTVQDDGPMDVVQTALLNMPGKEFGIRNNQTILDELLYISSK